MLSLMDSLSLSIPPLTLAGDGLRGLLLGTLRLTVELTGR